VCTGYVDVGEGGGPRSVHERYGYKKLLCLAPVKVPDGDGEQESNQSTATADFFSPLLSNETATPSSDVVGRGQRWLGEVEKEGDLKGGCYVQPVGDNRPGAKQAKTRWQALDMRDTFTYVEHIVWED